MRKRFKSRRLRLLAFVAVALLAGGGSAVAYFTTAGSGSGNASVATAQAVTITAGTPTSQLYPGGSADVAATFSNPNPSPVRVNSLLLDTSQGSSGFAVDGGHSGCGTGSLASPPAARTRATAAAASSTT